MLYSTVAAVARHRPMEVAFICRLMGQSTKGMNFGRVKRAGYAIDLATDDVIVVDESNSAQSTRSSSAQPAE